MARTHRKLARPLSLYLILTASIWLGQSTRAGGIPQELVGTWVATTNGSILVLRADGTITLGANSGRYWVQGNTLTIFEPKVGKSLPFRYEVRGNRLRLLPPGQSFWAEFVRQGTVSAHQGPGHLGGGTRPLPGSGGSPISDGRAIGPRGYSRTPGAAGTVRSVPQAQAAARTATITRSQALRILGRSKSYKLFTISTKIPRSWKILPIKRTDPDSILLFGHPVPGVRSGNDSFVLPVVVGPYLRVGSRDGRVLAAQVVQWMLAVVGPKLAAYEGLGSVGTNWSQPQTREGKAPSGKRLVSVSISSAQGQSRFLLVGSMVVDRGGHAAIFATGLVTSRRIARLSGRDRQLVMAGFRDLLQKMVAVAALTNVRPGRRDRSLERRLWRRGQFYYHSKSAYFNTGMYSSGSYETSSFFRVRFLPGRRCLVESSSASRAGWVNSNTGDSGAGAAGGDGGSGGAVHCEVRRGTKGNRWLVLYHPASRGGTDFHRIELRGSEKCGDRTFRGLSIAGHVEGEYVDVNGNCTRKRR